MKLLVTDPLSEEGLKLLTESGIPVDVRPGLSEDELCQIIDAYDGVIIRSGTTITAKVIDAGKNLKVIGRAGVGVDNVDVPHATRKGILVMNTPSANIISAAEHSLAMMMSLARNVVWAHNSVHSGKWERGKFTGMELFGKTLGILGVGRVGGEVAKRAKSFNMKLLGYDPYLPADIAENLGVKLTTVEEIITQADIITIHAPLTPATKDMIGAEQFEKMKPHALLINVARGGIVNEEALFEALSKKRIAGAAFDVFVQEPLPADSPLMTLPNLITTPHLGASTKEAQEKVSVEMAEHVIMFMRDGIISNAINAPRGQLQPEVAPYVKLAETLASFAHQALGERPVDKIEIKVHGDISAFDTRMVTVSAVIGLMSNIMGEATNIINAESLAKSKGISIVETKTDCCSHYNNMVSVKLTSGKETKELRGTVFPTDKPRIVGMDEFVIELPLDSNFFMAVYKDGPGVIGRIGRILGENGINIAQMSVGREGPDGNALMLMGVDHLVSDAVLKQIKESGPFVTTRFIRLLGKEERTYMA